MMGHHVRSESATATMRRSPSPPASLPSTSSTRLTDPARVHNLRSALRGLSISDPSPPTATPRAPLSPMSSALGPGPSRTQWSPTPNSSSNNSVLGTVARKNDFGPFSGRVSEEATERVPTEARLRQLKSYTQRLRAARVPGSDPGSVDSAYEEFARVKDEAAEAIGSLLAAHNSSRAANRSRRARNGSVAETVVRLESMRIAHGNTIADGEMDTLKASFGSLGLGESSSAPTVPRHEDRARHNRDSTLSSGPAQDDSSLAAIQDWRAVLVKLLQSHRRSLAATIQVYDRDAPLEVTEKALDEPDYRAGMIQKMRTRKSPLPSNAPAMSPAYWPWYERRFRHYDAVKETIIQVDRQLLTAAEGGGKRAKKVVRDYVIAPRGNAVLEFANTGGYDTPLLRFRVSSHMLAETSPIFEAVFGGQFSHPRILDRDLRDLDGQVPREPPRSVTCADGSSVKLYSMPQLEPNKEEALTILLYAAHMQNEKVPREVSFAQFTAIAEVCLKYQCTSPLELFVEHRWLPSWLHKASEHQPDGILLISYAFGLRRLFTRTSKTALLNIVDEEELWAKPWPHAMKEKIWAVRNAKLAQVYTACVGAVQEYFRPPGQASNDDGAGAGAASGGQRFGAGLPPSDDPPRTSSMLRPSSYFPNPPLPSYVSLFSLTSMPRCPKGDHWCDATSLGWLLLILNELQLIWTIVNPSVLPSAQGQHNQQPRSLAQLLDVLRSVPSPPHPAHLGSTVCDPAPALRAAVNDVYNSISGLTLFDVDGKRHGWGLSKHRLNEPQTIQNVSLGKLSLDGSSVRDEAVAQARNEDTRGLLQIDTEDSLFDNGTETDTTESEEGEVEDGSIADNTQRYQPSPPPAFAPDETLCLGVMRHADTFDDLHALALVSRAFYATYKKNELALMRPLVGAWRRQTLSALAGGPAQSQDVLPQELARLEELQARSEERKQSNHPSLPNSFSPPHSMTGHLSVEDDSLAEAAQLEFSYTTDTEGGNQGRGGDKAEHKSDEAREMTEEEAGRILWPDQPAQPDRNTVAGYLAKGKAAESLAWAVVAREDSGEKFLAGDLSLLTEDKSLAVLGDKSLGEDLDRRKGITSS